MASPEAKRCCLPSRICLHLLYILEYFHIVDFCVLFRIYTCHFGRVCLLGACLAIWKQNFLKAILHLIFNEKFSWSHLNNKGIFPPRKGHTNEMSDLVQLMTQTLKLDSKESCEDLPVPDPVSEFKLHRKYRDTLILHGKVAEETELHFKELPLGDQFILLQQIREHVYWRMCQTKKLMLAHFLVFLLFCLDIVIKAISCFMKQLCFWKFAWNFY